MKSLILLFLLSTGLSLPVAAVIPLTAKSGSTTVQPDTITAKADSQATRQPTISEVPAAQRSAKPVVSGPAVTTVETARPVRSFEAEMEVRQYKRRSLPYISLGSAAGAFVAGFGSCAALLQGASTGGLLLAILAGTLAVTAIITGAMGLKQPKNRPAKAGLVMGVVFVAVALLLMAIVAFGDFSLGFGAGL